MPLFAHQEQTIKDMRDRVGALIAHDLGCGKTLSAIGLDYVRRRRVGNPKLRTLIICPMSVVSQWASEYKKWCPELKVITCDNKNRRPFMDEVLNPNSKYQVFVMHYAAARLENKNYVFQCANELCEKFRHTYRRDKKTGKTTLCPSCSEKSKLLDKSERLRGLNWFHLIIDEAHNIENRKSVQTQAVKLIPANYRTALTGTPIRHKPDGFWSVLNFLYPQIWKSYWDFFENYIAYVDWTGYKEIIGVKNEEELLKKIKPFYSRVHKEDVFDMPGKYETEIYVDLLPQQRRAFDKMKKEMLAFIGQMEQDQLNAPMPLTQRTRLHQFGCAFGELEWVQVKNKISGELEAIEKMKLSEPSSKLDTVMEIIKGTHEHIVVFATSSQLLELLAKRLEKANVTYGLLIGRVAENERRILREEFQEGKRRVFLSTIKAGGEGIELTASSTIIFLDREFAQPRNEQAIGRCYRYGQTKPVQVIDIIASDTKDIERLFDINVSWGMVKKMLGEL